jgi:hypothetical protein
MIETTTLASHLQFYRKRIEADERIKGSFIISFTFSGNLHHGEAKAEWRIIGGGCSENNYNSVDVKGNNLMECVNEFISRVTRDMREAPIMIGCDAPVALQSPVAVAVAVAGAGAVDVDTNSDIPF